MFTELKLPKVIANRLELTMGGTYKLNFKKNLAKKSHKTKIKASYIKTCIIQKNNGAINLTLKYDYET
jgi:hypothetical protein